MQEYRIARYGCKNTKQKRMPFLFKKAARKQSLIVLDDDEQYAVLRIPSGSSE